MLIIIIFFKIAGNIIREERLINRMIRNVNTIKEKNPTVLPMLRVPIRDTWSINKKSPANI